MTSLRKLFGQNSDLALVVGVLGILLILFAPIPSVLLDLFIIVNFAFALTILLLTFYVQRPVDFSTFPSLLLIATLFRLSLNIAATRLILSSAEAGQVIAAIGTFVVQGNFVIGLIVFSILIVVQYVVVTNGAQRVSEVAARFVLDAMPGQQMSIDADLNMGLINQDEAKKRRKDLEKEAGFYGSMDGASKFVKGDAVAGIVILLINILGGWAIGVAQMGLPWGQALQTFTLLTIGDGIVTQVPALIISVATGIIVTRSAADTRLSSEVLRQLMLFPKIQLLVMLALIGLLMLPGMPKWPVLVLLSLIGAAWLALRMRKSEAADQLAQDGEQKQADGKGDNELAASAAVEISFGPAISKAWLPMQMLLGDRIAAFRKEFAQDLGFVIPPVAFRDSLQLSQHDYQISLHGDRFAQATIYTDRTLAIYANDKIERLPGIAAKDPAFGLPAIWIEANDTDKARKAGYTLVDPVTVLITHVCEVIKTNAAQLLSRSEVVRMLEGVRGRQPGLLEELVPAVLAVSDIQKILQNLLSENVSIRNLDLIAEVLVDVGRHQKDPGLLTEAVRQRIGYTICQALSGAQNALSVLTLEPGLEASIVQNVKASDGAGSYVLEPRMAEQFLMKLMSMAEAMMRQNLVPVLLCGPDVRRHIKLFSRRAVPRLAVLSVTEIPHAIDLKSFGVVNAAPAVAAN
ncbi:flagellar biosynthesis protein FlhA [Paraherbaspirillum soli]|uniref:Flagellar biosynthesis protein FlhA n=1 Tax=Paraherbaspirillum soli TaxID=631222 RepID=A0ABW0MBE1_9BURK